MFQNRQEAGRLLSQRLKYLKGERVIVLAIPRGGVVVGYEVAESLGCLLDIIVVKKIGAPGNEELAIGAVGPENIVVWDESLCRRVGVGGKIKEEKWQIKSKEREEKERLLRGKQPLPELSGKTVILVDDGVATGATTEAAIRFVQGQNPQKIILAVPVAPPDSVEKLKPQVDELICLEVEPDFWAVGQFYQEFPQVEDEEVIKILRN